MKKYRVVVSFDEMDEVIEAESLEEARSIAVDMKADVSAFVDVEEVTG